MSNAFTKTFTAADITSDALKGKGLVLVDFWAAWCGPCRMVGPIIDQLAMEFDGKVLIGKLNVDEQADAAVAYGVASIPTLILFKDGVEIERLIGAHPKPVLVDMINKQI